MRELSHHILDLLENAIGAEARHISLTITEEIEQGDRLEIIVADDGKGMDADRLARIKDPFFTTRTTRHVGLGVPLLAAAAERCDGGLTIESNLGEGTTVRAWFSWRHIDRAPLGDIESTVLGALLAQREGRQPPELRYTHAVDGRTFALDTQELRELLGDVPLTHPQVRGWLQDYIHEGLDEIRAGDEMRTGTDSDQPAAIEND